MSEPGRHETASGTAIRQPRAAPLAWLAAALAGAFVASLLIGPAGFGLGGGSEAARLILTEIRLPRAALGGLIGAALALSGAALQGYLRNPLAEPGLLGVTGGASLGAVLAIHSGAAGAFALALPLAGLLGASGATLAVLALAGERSGALTLILAGVAVATLASALTTLALNLSSNPFASVEMVYWLMGSLNDRSLVHLWIAAPLIAAGMALLLRTADRLDVLALGDDVAANLGVDLRRLRLEVVLGSALAVGAATAVTGSIGFVGLVVPHVLRPLVGNAPGRLLAASALGGGVLVLAADIAVRFLSPQGDLRLGVVTALIGAPFFLWLVVRLRRELSP